ncbi:hypothetical protein Tco_1165883 [Tanacetum coccineum]
MEEYIQLMADKARGCDKTFNWETATYGKEYCDDLDSFTDFEIDFPAIVYNDASTSNQNVSSEPTVSIYNAIKSDIDFHISFSDSEDEDYAFIYNKDSSSYKLVPTNDLEPELVNDYVEINIESCSENIHVKPMDSVICISNDTTPIEFDENIETNHDIHHEAKRRNSGAKMKTFEEYSYLLPYVVSSKEDTAYQRQLITRICVRSIPNTAYHSSPIRRISSWSSVKDLQLMGLMAINLD